MQPSFYNLDNGLSFKIVLSECWLAYKNALDFTATLFSLELRYRYKIHTRSEWGALISLIQTVLAITEAYYWCQFRRYGSAEDNHFFFGSKHGWLCPWGTFFSLFLVIVWDFLKISLNMLLEMLSCTFDPSTIFVSGSSLNVCYARRRAELQIASRDITEGNIHITQVCVEEILFSSLPAS